MAGMTNDASGRVVQPFIVPHFYPPKPERRWASFIIANKMLSVREIQPTDVASIVQYWQSADPAFLTGMGVDLSKMPSREVWAALLSEQLSLPYAEKKSYCLIW